MVKYNFNLEQSRLCFTTAVLLESGVTNEEVTEIYISRYEKNCSGKLSEIYDENIYFHCQRSTESPVKLYNIEFFCVNS